MKISKPIIVCLMFIIANTVFALEARQILVVANSDIPESVEIAKYYCTRRAVPSENLLTLSLGDKLTDKITRSDYEKKLVTPILKKLFDSQFADIKCLLMTYGTPIKVGRRGRLKDREKKLRELKKLVDQLKGKIANLEQLGSTKAIEHKKKINFRLIQLQSAMDQIIGKETNASVDSELSMVLFGNYELYRWQPNELKNSSHSQNVETLMVSRIDGPSSDIAKGIIDKAISAETTGLKGIAYIDSGHSQ